jgi:small-conductance mechanosensitive channel
MRIGAVAGARPRGRGPLAWLAGMLLSLPAATADSGTVHELFLRFGATESVARTAQVILVGPLHVALTVLIAAVIARLVPRLARKLVHSLQLRTPLWRPSTEVENRATTIATVLASVFRAIVWIIAGLTIFGELGIKLAPFVAGATVVGAALGFGAQSLVRDFLSGVLIVLEDQYRVGDTILIGDTTGTVEGLNLRTTQIRSLDGTVWYIPNGEIRKLGNTSEGYNQAILDLLVPPGTDLVRAGQLAQEEARAMAAEAPWSSIVRDPPTYVGVQDVTVDGATLRLVARTPAGEHQRVARALRERIYDRFRREGVAWVPAQAQT